MWALGHLPSTASHGVARGREVGDFNGTLTMGRRFDKNDAPVGESAQGPVSAPFSLIRLRASRAPFWAMACDHLAGPSPLLHRPVLGIPAASTRGKKSFAGKPATRGHRGTTQLQNGGGHLRCAPALPHVVCWSRRKVERLWRVGWRL